MKRNFRAPFGKHLLVVPLLAASLALVGCGSSSDPLDVTEMEADADTNMGDTDTNDPNTGDTDMSDTETGDTDMGDTDTGDTDTGDTDTGDTEMGDTDTVDTDSGDTDMGDADADASSGQVILTTIASDFSSSALDIYSLSEPREGQTAVNPGVSDTIVRAFEDTYYVIRRFESDSITAYSSSDTSTPIFQSSTNDGNDPASSNPHDLVFVDSQKAYLLRYGSPIVWVVNPSATEASQFKTGEIDLSAYDADGVPETTRGVVVGNRLFVFMQRLDGFAPTQNGYVAVINTDNNSEIDTGSDGELMGIELPAFNPNDVSLDEASGSIFVAAVGDYGAFDGSRLSALTGGIVTVDTSDFSANLLVDDTEETGRITAVEVVDASTAYMITETGYQASTLVKFDPNTGAILESGVGGYADVDVRDIAVGPAGNLWVAVGSVESPKVVVLNPADGSVAAAEIGTTLNPAGITFVD